MTNFALPAFTLDDLAAYLDSRAVIQIRANENPNALDLGSISAFIWNGVIYDLDPDAGSGEVSDPFTVVNNGKVYRAVGTDAIGNANIYSVIDAVGTPPQNPQIEDNYLVFGTLTGDFAGKLYHMATFTNYGWLFTFPRTGKNVFNERTRTQWIFDGSIWINGLPANLQIGTVNNTSLRFPMGISVQSVGGNVPPNNPFPGEAFIIGDNPIGQWQASARALALYTGPSVEIFPPYEGAEVYALFDDPNTGNRGKRRYRYDGTAWIAINKQTLIESKYVELNNQTISNDGTLGTRPSWQIGTDNTFPKVIGDGDFLEVQLQEFSARWAVENDPNYNPSEANINYAIDLGFYSGNSRFPFMVFYSNDFTVFKGSGNTRWRPPQGNNNQQDFEFHQEPFNAYHNVRHGLINGSPNDDIKLYMSLRSTNDRVIIRPDITNALQITGLEFTFKHYVSSF